MVWLILGLIVFLGIHSVRMVAPGWRDSIIADRGKGAWRGIYSVIALVGLVLLIWGYGQARLSAPVIYDSPNWISHLVALLMVPAFIILVSSNFPAGRIKATLKHPMLVSIKIWAFAHLLANGDLASIILFGSFLAWAVWNRIAVKRRGDPVFGTVTVRNDVLSIVIGGALYVAFILWLHAWLIGVPPITM